MNEHWQCFALIFFPCNSRINCFEINQLFVVMFFSPLDIGIMSPSTTLWGLLFTLYNTSGGFTRVNFHIYRIQCLYVTQDKYFDSAGLLSMYRRNSRPSRNDSSVSSIISSHTTFFAFSYRISKNISNWSEFDRLANDVAISSNLIARRRNLNPVRLIAGQNNPTIATSYAS